MAMRNRLVWCAAFSAVVLGCTTGNGPGAATHGDNQAARRTLRNDTVGYTLSYPRGWKVAGKVVATQFAIGARCQSVRVVDSRGLAQVRQSFVQLCWKRVTDGSSLAEFMRRTYGRRLGTLFERTTLAGGPAYRTRGPRTNRTFFVQSATHRIQLVAAVVAAPARRATRLAQVNRILRSLTLER
jgi:hypothetical protein